VDNKHIFSLLLLIIIKLYWFFKPKNKNRKCNFRISCSHYVYNAIHERGFMAGIIAFRNRWNRCRSIYRVERKGEVVRIRFRDGYLANLTELSDSFIKEATVIGGEVCRLSIEYLRLL